jgi:hypothetical protein
MKVLVTKFLGSFDKIISVDQSFQLTALLTCVKEMKVIAGLDIKGLENKLKLVI